MKSIKKISNKAIIGVIAAVAAILLLIPIVANASTLNITNTLIGRTYDAYLFFEMDDGNMTITDSSPFKASFDDYNAENPGKFIVTDLGSGKYKVVPSNDFTEDDAAELARVTMNRYEIWKDAKVASKVADSANVTFENLEKDGYYLVKSSAGTVLSMVTVNGTGTINEKNAGCEWGKLSIAIDRPAVGYYENVKVTTTFDFYETYSFVEKQLEISNNYVDGTNVLLNTLRNITIKDSDGSLVPANWYELTKSDSGYTIIFKEPAVFRAGQSIIIEGTATATEALKLYDSSKNILDENVLTAVAYDLKAEDPITPIDNTTATFRSLQFGLTKLPNDSNKVLFGAEFKMYRTETSDEPVNFIKQELPDGRTNYVVSKERTAVDTIQVGYGDIIGVGTNTYWVEETKAPDGYNPLRERISTSLTDDSNATVVDMVDGEPTYVSGGLAVVNRYGVEIPATGGIGAIILVVLGASLVIGSIAYRTSRRKVDSDITA